MRVIPLRNIPMIKEGDDLPDIILDTMRDQQISIDDGDVLVIAQSIVSKAEGNIFELNDMNPSERAMEIGEKIDQDPRVVELVLRETREIIRLDRVLISETKHGFICANAGVDASNAGPGRATVLPDNPGRSATAIRNRIEEETDADIAVIISDSWGRPFRFGAVGFAVGISGIEPLKDLRGSEDAYGEELKSTIIAPPDPLAAIGSLQMGEANERTPIVIIKNSPYESGGGSISDLVRPPEEDLFR